MFEKKIEIFKKKDREAWTEIRDLLKKEGVAGISAGHYLQESVMAGGCGAKLDFRQKRKDRQRYLLYPRQGSRRRSGQGDPEKERDHGRHRRGSDDGRRPEKTPFLYLKGHFLQSHPYQVLCRVCDAVQLPYAYIFLPVDLLHVFQM